jgi:hypothetical protein
MKKQARLDGKFKVLTWNRINPTTAQASTFSPSPASTLSKLSPIQDSSDNHQSILMIFIIT